MTVDLVFIFVAGLLGSSHCLGMCGPFALVLGSGTRKWHTNLGRQCTYTLGRLFTYAMLGGVAGFAGWKLHRETPVLLNVAAALAIAAGLFLLVQGLKATGVLPTRGVSAAAPCLGGAFLSHFLRRPGWLNVLLAGVFTGLLPCGLVYGFLALAASSGNVFRGSAVMVAFGAGTAPIMVLAGCGSSMLSLISRHHLVKIAGWCVVVTGAVSIVRGFGFLQIPGLIEGSCPMCP